jgi:hypothetical protein
MIEKQVAKIKSFKDLKIWRKGVQLVEDVYAATRTFPKEEKYGLTSQLRRSAVSIPSNISEGFARFHRRSTRNSCMYRSEVVQSSPRKLLLPLV